ncbi:MAG: hypothetical protein KJO06_08135 [Gemmatimonadetes bacterium]|nr:hypothetical protein [Gemmatimonadota bacterium]NNK47645.1 hypothetical protein [Gemmatimonadota bacterium]
MSDPPDPRQGVRRIPVGERSNKVSSGDFAGPPPPDPDVSFQRFYDSLPHILAADSLRAVASGIASAVARDRAIVWMLGGHVVKTGLSLVLIDLMERGAVTHLAVNGATVIHDYETCRWGGTSEDVEAGLSDGTFGMALETGRDMNMAIRRGRDEGLGLGAALAADLDSRTDNQHPELSLIMACQRLGIPLSVHVAVGSDIIHQHPEADGAAIGETSYADFLTLVESLKRLDDGGAAVNVGSAVILPEVFLKALTIRRNVDGGAPRGFLTADFDMIRQYRPRVNVVERPTRTGGGQGYQITGHHEIMVPLLAWAVAEELSR